MDTNQKIKSIIAEKLGVALEKVVDSARFVEDLGADSLDTVELVMQLEEEFNCEIPDSVTMKLTTVKSVIDYVSEQQKPEE